MAYGRVNVGGSSGLQIKSRQSGVYIATPSSDKIITFPKSVNINNSIVILTSDFFSQLEYYFQSNTSIKYGSSYFSSGEHPIYWEVIEFNKKVHNLEYKVSFGPNEFNPTAKYNIDVKNINKVLMLYNKNATPKSTSSLEHHNDIGIELGNDTSGNFIKLHFRSTHNDYYSATIRIFLIEFD